MTNGQDNRPPPPEPLKIALARLKQAADQDRKNGEFYSGTKLLDQVKMAKRDDPQGVPELQQWLQKEPTRIAFGAFIGSIQSIKKIFPEITQIIPTFDAMCRPTKEDNIEELAPVLVNILVSEKKIPPEIRTFIAESLVSAQNYTAEMRKVYTFENALDHKSALGQLMKPALVEGLIKDMTILTPESLTSSDASRGVVEAKNAFAKLMSEKVRSQIESGAKQDIISDDMLNLALSTDLLVKPPLVMSQALQAVFKDDTNKSPHPDKYSFVNLTKLENPVLQDKFLNVSGKLLEDIAKQQAQKPEQLNQAQLKNILNKSLATSDTKTRDMLKSMDRIIEQDLIFPVKYPKETSFVRKLLHLSPKRQAEKINADFKEVLPKTTDKLKAQILKNPKFHNAEGKLIISNEQLNLMIYERISLKASRQLGIDKEIVDKAFVDRNDAVYFNILGEDEQLKEAKAKQNIADISKFQDGFTKELNDLIPPHLLSKVQISTLLTLGQSKGLAASIRTLETHLKTISTYPSREVDCINVLEHLRVANIQDATRYDQQIQSSQERLYTRLSAQMHSKQKPPKNRLSDFEKAGIDLIKKAETEPLALNSHEKKYLTKFIEYSSGNTKFNKRLGAIQQKDNMVISNNAETLKLLHKYSYKTRNIEKTEEVAKKLDHILTQHVTSGGKAVFAESEKVSLHDIGYVSKIDDEAVGKVSELIKDAKLESKTLESISRIYDASCSIKQQLEENLEQEIKLKGGELVMDVAKSYHKLNHHTEDFSTKIKDFMTSYSHAAIGLDDNQVHQIQGNYWSPRGINPIASLATDQFVVAPEKLISSAMRGKVAIALDIKDQALLNEKLKQMYNEAAMSVNEDQEQKGLKGLEVENSDLRRIKAGIADIIPFGHRGAEEVKSWAQKVSAKKEQGQALGSILASETKGDMICSEFAAKMTVLTLAKLDKKLIQEIQKKDPAFKPPPDGVVRLPFAPKENLSKISPERLVKQLQRVGAIEKVEQKGLAQTAIRR